MAISTRITGHTLWEWLRQSLAALLCLIILLPAVLVIYLGIFIVFVLCGRFMRVANGVAEAPDGRSARVRDGSHSLPG
ncbi:MAG: hypothetical protein KDI09_01745 [Halioglobus sp.]|nr:hypothetical protein [Halioglobus sp.]